VISPIDFAVALSGFVFLVVWKTRPLYVVFFMGAAGIAISLAK
jgi:hypothetical protein